MNDNNSPLPDSQKQELIEKGYRVHHTLLGWVVKKPNGLLLGAYRYVPSNPYFQYADQAWGCAYASLLWEEA